MIPDILISLAETDRFQVTTWRRVSLTWPSDHSDRSSVGNNGLTRELANSTLLVGGKLQSNGQVLELYV